MTDLTFLSWPPNEIPPSYTRRAWGEGDRTAADYADAPKKPYLPLYTFQDAERTAEYYNRGQAPF